MDRTHVRWGRVAVVSATVLTAIAAAGSGAARERPASGGARGSAVVHIVRPGDTLWDIARAAVGPEGDPRPLVERIRARNALSSPGLVVGQRLVLPLRRPVHVAHAVES